MIWEKNNNVGVMGAVGQVMGRCVQGEIFGVMSAEEKMWEGS